MRGPAALIENGRVNPSYLKLDLFCRGLRLAEDLSLHGTQPVLRMRSGLGSGLELRIGGPRGICVNAPVVEPFAQESPYELGGPAADGLHRIRRDGAEVARVYVPARPRFLDQRTASGKPMGSVGVVQGTVLGVYYGRLCANWLHAAEEACRFCSVGDNLREGDDRLDKTPDDVVETALAAQRELGTTFVHVNGGFDDHGDLVERFLPLVEGLKSRTRMLVGLQVPPLEELEAYDAFRRAGVNNLSLCFEIWNPERFAEVCPGKNRRAGLARYRAAIRHAAEEVRFDTTNGELIAGLERIEDTCSAVDWLVSTGAIPTVCVFRPVRGTPYADLPPPKTEDLAPVFAHAYRRTMERGLPIGVAPGIRVSLVLTPEEWRGLLPREERSRWPLRRLGWRALRGAYGLAFRLRRPWRSS